MSFDEYIFSKFIKFFDKKKDDPALQERKVSLGEIKPKLTVLARALTGEAIELYPAEREGGYKGTRFFLPETFALYPSQQENLSFYVFRILYLSVQKSLQFNWPSGGEYSLNESQQKAFDTSNLVLEAMQKDFPSALEMHRLLHENILPAAKENQPDWSWLYGKWFVEDGNDDTPKPLDTNKTQPNSNPRPLTTAKAKAVEEMKLIQVDKKSQEDYVMTHNFEKVETAEEYDGVWRDFDGSDQMDDHNEALDELNMKFTVRADDQAHSVYQADFAENTTIAESRSRDDASYHIDYDEWDYRKGAYKPNYCKVFPVFPSLMDVDYYLRVIAENKTALESLRKSLAHVNNKRKQIRYQTQGEDFDIDRVTDMFVDLHLKQTPTEKIYFASRKAEKDISILLLLDSSLSTDSYAAGNRVIDVEKQVSILFGEILNEYGIDFSICSFWSHTRNHSTFLTLKAFDESWKSGRYRVGAIEPHGYTRIGASIRHAGAMLEKQPSANKWIILISDGKPNDYDTYEGKYGVKDVKQSLRELHARNINTFALAVEAQARYYLPQMFGQNHYQILTNTNELLAALVKLFTKIKQM